MANGAPGDPIIDDDGDVCLDWRTGDGDLLSLSIGADGLVSYAIRMADGRSMHGRAEISPNAFEVLRKIADVRG